MNFTSMYDIYTYVYLINNRYISKMICIYIYIHFLFANHIDILHNRSYIYVTSKADNYIYTLFGYIQNRYDI